MYDNFFFSTNNLTSVVEPGKPSWKLIVKHFGQEVLLPDGQINRSKLGEIIFQDDVKRRLLNKCTHPYIQRAMLWQVFKFFITGTLLLVLDCVALCVTVCCKF